MTDGDGKIIFARTRLEKVLAVIAILVGAETAYIGVQTTLRSPLFELACDRAADRCTLQGADIFGGSWTSHQPLSPLRRSEARPWKGGEVAWIVTDAAGKPWQIGNPSGRGEQTGQYRTLAPELQRFLEDPAQKLFKATFHGLGGPSGALFVIIAGLFLASGLLVVNGWRTTLVVDGPAHAVTIERRPSLFGPRTVRLERITRAEVGNGWMLVLFALLRTLRFTLIDDTGRRVFVRRTFLDRRRKAQLEEWVTSINQALRG